ncbi:hypothetical protein D3C76_1661900 [compost metagenome]
MRILAWKDRCNGCTNEHFSVQSFFHITHTLIVSLDAGGYFLVIMLPFQRTVSQKIQFDIGETKILELIQKIIHPHLGSGMCHVQGISPV